ncbi:MAG: hypothetical protein RL748_1033 [Pseudomonadota bacterium]
MQTAMPTFASSTLLQLLQLASPSLPIGAYCYSQGLESAIDQGLVHDEASAHDWISGYLQQVMVFFEAPILWRLLQAFAQGDAAAVCNWTDTFLAARDSSESRAETVQMGYSLTKLIIDLRLPDARLLAILHSLPETPLPTALACASVALKLPHQATLLAMLFSWAENQVLACVKTVPLGQVAGQRLLFSLHAAIEQAALVAQTLGDEELNNWNPALSLLAMQHEVQYSRIYRS